MTAGKFAIGLAAVIVALGASAGVADAKTKAKDGPGGATSYWVVTSSGKVCAAGSAKTYGNGNGAKTVTGILGTSDGKGYWLIYKSGKHAAFGDARSKKFKSAKAVKWTTTLRSCKSKVVSAAVAKIPAAKKGAPPKTTTSTTPTTTTSTPPTSPSNTTTTSTPPATPAMTLSLGQTADSVEVGAQYLVTFTAAGGTGSYTYLPWGGSLPSGVSLNTSTGVLSGSPTTTGSYSYTVLAVDSQGDQAQATATFTVIAGPSITTSVLPTGEENVSYDQTLTAIGGTGPYTWSVASGSLPSGLSLASNGTITGTPSGNGSDSFTAQATDGDGVVATRVIGLSVAAPLSLTANTLPDPVAFPDAATILNELDDNGTYNPAPYESEATTYAATLAGTYSQAVGSTSGGTGTVTYVVTSDSIPAGMTLSSAGVLSGDPSSAGAFSFSVTATDSLGGTATASYSGLVAEWNDEYNVPTWSGYVETGASAYTSVTGTYTVADVYGASGDTSEWVGIDGDGNDYLIQAGTDATTDGRGYFAWTEIIAPGSNVETTVSGFTVNPGDSITVTITETDPATDQWTISLSDNTSDEHYSTTVTYAGPGGTAEWIVETPNSDGHVESAAPFGNTLSFTQLGASQPATGLQYMTFAPDFTYADVMNSFLTPNGFAVTDNGTIPNPPQQ